MTENAVIVHYISSSFFLNQQFVLNTMPIIGYDYTGVQLEGHLGKILALGAEILPFIGLREKWEFSLKKNIFFFYFSSGQHTIDKV